MMSDQASLSLDDPLPAAIGAPALRALRGVGITVYGDILAWSVRDLEELHGVGPTAIGILREGLDLRGATFAPPSGA